MTSNPSPAYNSSWDKVFMFHQRTYPPLEKPTADRKQELEKDQMCTQHEMYRHRNHPIDAHSLQVGRKLPSSSISHSLFFSP